MKKTLVIIVTFAFSATLLGQVKILSNNNVGIHTDNPLSKVAVGNEGSSNYMFSIYNNLSADYTRGLYVYMEPNAYHRYTIQGSTSSAGGDYAYGIYGSSYSSTANSSGRAYGLYGLAGNAANGYNYGTVGRLYGSNNGAGIYGTMSSTDQNTGGKYAGFFYGSVKITGSLTVSGTITSSDTNLKKDIKNLENGCASKLMQLKALKYKLKSPAELSVKNAKSDTLIKAEMTPEMEADFARERIGLSAQEVQLVYPELVVEGQDGTLGVDYTGLIPVLIEAIKEQQEEIEELKAAIIKDKIKP